MWLKVCPEGTKVTTTSRLCDKHFPTSSFFQTPKKRFKKLNHDAVPLPDSVGFLGKYKIDSQVQEQDAGCTSEDTHFSDNGRDLIHNR